MADQKQSINIGTTANDGTGTTLRAGGDLINDNFALIFADNVSENADFDLAIATHGGQYTNVDTSGGAVTATIRVEATEDLGDDVVYWLRRDGGNALTIQGATGVTINGSSAGSVALSSNRALALVKKIGSDAFAVSIMLPEVAAAGLNNVADDTTPQLGGNLDVDGKSIVSTLNGNITLAPNGTGNVALGNYTLDADATVGAGQDKHVLTYDNSVGLISLKATTEVLIVAVGDEDTDLTTGTAKTTFRAPFAATLSEIRASVKSAPTGAALTVDVNVASSSVFSTLLTIDAGETTSETAATAAVIGTSAVADDAEITVDIDQVGSTDAGTGLKVALYWTRA